MQISAGVKALLWEYSLDEVPAGERWEKTIIERVMQRGCWEDMRWLLRTFDRSRLRSFLKNRGRRVLAPREIRFWARICGVPDNDQEVWVREARVREWTWRG